MGACTFHQLVVGRFKNVSDAYAKANEEAKDENGHQQGYSGDIQTIDFPLFTRKHPRFGTKAFDKWEQDKLDKLGKREGIVIELTGAVLKRYKDNRGWKGCRNIRGYYFFGWGAC